MEILGDDLDPVLQGLKLLRSAQLTDIPNTLEYLYQRVKAEVVGEEEQSKDEEQKAQMFEGVPLYPIECFQTPFGYDPFISPNPFGGAMNETTPF